jgi:hypothetical protein
MNQGQLPERICSPTQRWPAAERLPVIRRLLHIAGFCLFAPWGTVSIAAEASVPVRLIIQPSTIEIDGPQARQRVLVTAVDKDGRFDDVTAKASYAIDKAEVAAVSVDGECRGKGDGQGVVTVKAGGLSATVSVTCRNSGVARVPSFVNDVEPLFTKLGCNQGSCHGKGMGQNGFRLSLRGYAPELDYMWLTREFDGRRINTAVPADSLLLRKPLGLAAHEGGKVFSEGSREHAVFYDWLRAGAPGLGKNELVVKKLEILPGDRMLRVGQEQRLLVTAEYSDGGLRDVTWLTRFDSNDAGMAEVDSTGKVKILRSGETAIRASFMGQVAVVIMTVPFDQAVSADAIAKKNNFVDEHVFNKLGALHIEPSPLSSDAEFVRRVYLDAIGTLPKSEEIRAFLDDKNADKRAKLIDRLLDKPEFNDYWALEFGDLFQNRKERDHDVRGSKGVRAFHEWLREQVAKNRPWDELARAVITATGSTADNPAVGYFIVTVGEDREAERSEVVASVAQAFLGTRVGCCKCHNHPLEKYTQDDYYHFAAYFSRVKLERKEPKQGPTKLLTSASDPNQNKNPVGVIQPRTGQFLKPQPLDRTQTTVEPSDDPRVKLAEWITDPKNESFSGAMVNRLWRHYLGVGLVEPVDDLRASNPPSNPELWQALNREFVAHKYDLRHLMRLILNSRTYQLESATNKKNEAETRFYSHYYARRLPAEVLLDSISQATGVPDTFPGYPVGVRAVQLPDPAMKSYFLSLFGRSERVTACACERNGEVTMPQLLHLQNSESITQRIRSADGRLAALLKAKNTDAEIMEELFLATLSRTPTAAETAEVKKELLATTDKEEVWRDLFWALLNSKEFSFNH